MYTLTTDYRVNNHGYFGAVNIQLGTKQLDARILHIRRNNKEDALNDAAKLERRMIVLGINCPVNVNEYV